MAAIFEGKIVTVLRPAIHGDQNFKEGGGEQVLIRLSDGTEKIVAKSEVKETEQPVTSAPVVAAPAPVSPPSRQRPTAAQSRKRRR